MNKMQKEVIDNLLSKKVVKCPKCGYSWLTNSTMFRVTCPSCQNKVIREAKK